MTNSLKIVYVDDNKHYSLLFKKIVIIRDVKHNVITSPSELEEYFQSPSEKNGLTHFIVGDFQDLGETRDRTIALTGEIIDLIKKRDPAGRITLYSLSDRGGKSLADNKSVEFRERKCPSIGDLINDIIKSNQPYKR